MRLILLGNFGLGAQPVEHQAADEIVCYVGPAFQPERIVAAARDQEIEHDLALRGEQRAGFGLIKAKCIQVERQDILQKMLGIGAGNIDDGAVGEDGCRHGPDLAFRRAIT